MFFPHFECYGNEILAGFKSRSNYTMQPFARVRITAFRRRNYCVRASINQHFQIQLAFQQNYCYVPFNYTCWNSTLLVLGSSESFHDLNKQINATVITQPKRGRCSVLAKTTEKVAHAGAERHLRFHHPHRYRCHYLFFSMQHAGITPVPPLPLRTWPEHF